MEFRVLGPVSVIRDGERLAVGGAKQRAVLAMLLLARGATVSRENLVDGVWGTSPPETVHRTMSAYVSRLRRTLLEDGLTHRLTREPRGYRLRVEPGELDLDQFDSLAEDAQRALDAGEHRHAQSLLTQALSLFAGTPLQDLLDIPACRLESDRISERRVWALEQRVASDLITGNASGDIADLRSLLAKEPFREHSWTLLMRALYQSGQQREALLAFDHARRIFDEELGVEPGPELRSLQHQILVQDRALDPPQSRSPMTLRSVAAPGPTRRRGRMVRAAIPVVALATAVVASTLLASSPSSAPGSRAHGLSDFDPASVQPGTVVVDLSTGRQTGFIPRSKLSNAAYPIYAGGHFWVNEWEPSAFVEIDPRSGRVIRHIDPPATQTPSHQESATVTPFAVDGDSLWVTAGDDLVRISVSLGRETDRIRLDDAARGSGLAEGVVVGGGSVWVSRDVGRGQVIRLDPATGAVLRVWDHLRPHDNLAYGAGTLWAGDPRGLVSIDAATGSVTSVPHVHGNCSGGGGGCVMATGDVGWTSRATAGRIYKSTADGHVADVIRVPIGAGFMGQTPGKLWVGGYSDGTVSGYDPSTGSRIATYQFPHPVETVTAGDHYLLVSLGTGQPIADIAARLPAPSAVFLAHPGELGDGDEPALNVDVGAYQIEYATCANLLRYPDAPLPAGAQLAPDVAAAMPSVSKDQRTYRFTISPGFRFSPPSNEPVTAKTFKHSIERALSPRLADNSTGQRPPAPTVIDDIVGEAAYRRGDRDSVRGIQVDGDTLSITLVKPSPDFLVRLTTPFFCPVPMGTPFVGGGPYIPDQSGGGTVVSDGPYYVADEANGSFVMLEQNPNYAGSRPRRFKAIMIREDVAAAGAITMVTTGAADGTTYLPGNQLRPGGPADRRWTASTTPSYHLTRSGGQTIAQLIGPRIGCRIYNPNAFGLDLAATCPTYPTR